MAGFTLIKKGNELYTSRFLSGEPFYSGFALVVVIINEKKMVFDEMRRAILNLS